MEEMARYGWESDFPKFQATEARVVREALHRFVTDASPAQVHAWDDSIPPLQREVGEVLKAEAPARSYTTLLEYELPMESRRPDVVLLVGGAVVVLELKGKSHPSQADIDQASAYARDLRCYHRCCSERNVHAVLVPMRAQGYQGQQDGVHIAGPDALNHLIATIKRDVSHPAILAKEFLAAEAYCPLPTLVQAARELILSRKVRQIHRARAATEPAVGEIARIIHEAAATRTRRLILLTGVPGAGKTLVGLQVVHAPFLDDLAVPRGNARPTAPAVFLSGNGPLVEVLQYSLKSAGGGGKTFVRGVLDYVKRYSAREDLVPPEHVLVFDEAQRAFDAEQVRTKHSQTPGFGGGRSEPEHFIEFASRIPEWCVVVGLIGTGQEIHVGEEGGLVQWRRAVEGAVRPKEWTVHLPPQVRTPFEGSEVAVNIAPVLSLDTEIRFHLASDIHRFVEGLLVGGSSEVNRVLASSLEKASYHLRITRDLDVARQYLRERYSENPLARFGLVASSKDRDLERFGVANDFQSTKRVRYGPWYNDDEKDEGERSCRHLRDCVTEFGAQGLELDAALLAWGTDFVWTGKDWSNGRARGYLRSARVKSPFQLRLNAYRVLLTRGRDATVVFVPPLAELDATFAHLKQSGFRALA